MGPAALAIDADAPSGDAAGAMRRPRTRVIAGANGNTLRTPVPLLPTHRGQLPFLPVPSIPTEQGETLALSVYAGDMAGVREILSEGGYDTFASFARLPPSVLFLILHSPDSAPPIARRRSNLISLESPGARVSLSAEQLAEIHDALGTDFVETPNGRCKNAAKTAVFASKALADMKVHVKETSSLFRGLHIAGGPADAVAAVSSSPPPPEEPLDVNSISVSMQDAGGVAVTGTYDDICATKRCDRLEFVRDISLSTGRNVPLMVLGGDGAPGDVLELIRCGVDIMCGSFPFDCAARGEAIDFARGVKIMLRSTCYIRSKDAIVTGCECSVCPNYSRSYIHHMDAINEMLAPTLLAKHNLWAYNRWFDNIRQTIERGQFQELYTEFFERRAKLVAEGAGEGIQPL